MQKPLLDYSEWDHLVPADLGVGRQVVQPCLGEMELDKAISLSLSGPIRELRFWLSLHRGCPHTSGIEEVVQGGPGHSGDLGHGALGDPEVEQLPDLVLPTVEP